MSAYRALRDRTRSQVTDRIPRASCYSPDRRLPTAIARRNLLQYRRDRSEERRGMHRVPSLRSFVIKVKICGGSR